MNTYKVFYTKWYKDGDAKEHEAYCSRRHIWGNEDEEELETLIMAQEGNVVKVTVEEVETIYERY